MTYPLALRLQGSYDFRTRSNQAVPSELPSTANEHGHRPMQELRKGYIKLSRVSDQLRPDTRNDEVRFMCFLREQITQLGI